VQLIIEKLPSKSTLAYLSYDMHLQTLPLHRHKQLSVLILTVVEHFYNLPKDHAITNPTRSFLPPSRNILGTFCDPEFCRREATLRLTGKRSSIARHRFSRGRSYRCRPSKRCIYPI